MTLLDVLTMEMGMRTVASEVLVFYVVGLREAWRHSTAYFYTNKLSSHKLKDFIEKAIDKLHNAGVRHKMKVKYASQVFSCSVAKSLQLLNGFHVFSDVSETMAFVKNINDLFHILNNKLILDREWKQSITKSNLTANIDKLYEMKAYLLSLKNLDGVNIYKTQRKMCIIGLDN
ncbi:hypothetical protein HELRODRAFT_166831 [Helobdella robusta]|uniref:Transposable element P transposase-like GTP-binding insertion domain-containing protein n=1 Tax=Helobdella robusta TaxID=6412 RepID=T1EYL4_HELRO|nr:hypothetical protein HELRODRAFT_166831 [Helobdella robusta]ESO11788.1 hypothetical protein HELRODRAFT_166831 [Helobdella robusta]